MEKRRYFFGMCMLAGLILGSLFANFVYQSNLIYNDQINRLILKTQKVEPNLKLLLYILLKRGKQYAIIYLLGYILQPMVLFVLGFFFFSFLMGSVLSLQIIASGFQGVFQVMLHLFPHFIFYGICLYLLFQRNGRDMYMKDYGYAQEDRAVKEMVFLFIGIIMECFINPMIIS
ncbi:MAG: hypothetical protein PHD70_03920 [Anaerostipes sp.]|nr:hypothetical protein [Anaerostipes sp.]